MATSLLALPCKMRALLAQATVRALPRDELATQAFLRSWRTRGRAVCQPTGSRLSNYWLTVKDTRGRGYRLDWKGKGSTIHLVTEGNGLPLAFLVTAANVSEVTAGLQVVDQVRVSRPQGRPRQRPASLAADKSYDSADFRWELRRRGIQPSIRQRKWKGRRHKPGRLPLEHGVSHSRRKVERSHGWLDNWWRLVTRYDWYTESYVALLTIACFMIALARILH